MSEHRSLESVRCGEILAGMIGGTPTVARHLCCTPYRCTDMLGLILPSGVVASEAFVALDERTPVPTRGSGYGQGGGQAAS
jgi:hypothetical protein